MTFPTYHRRLATARRGVDANVTRVRYGPHSRQYVLLVNRPGEALQTTGKLAIYFHGGAWTFGRPEWFLPAALPWLNRGFTVALVSHRRFPRVGLRRIVADCWAAVDAVVRSPDPITRNGQLETLPAGTAHQLAALHLGGMSAGAHLAAVLATDERAWRLRQRAPGKVLLNAGPLSFAELPVARLFLPHYATLDPLQRLAPASPQSPDFRLTHGTADVQVSIRHARAFHRRLLQLGHQSQLNEIPGGNHLAAGTWMFEPEERRKVEAWIEGGRG